ncbi:MAG: hypothetical protein J7463_17380 [Roseiflexus sp.]|nr:hypothetical protein [Roseiflexus sp.]MBO9333617.1 hypothetical protein [Roseiflexus sp.]MBO9363518.1 hypothetical protein [Roseiflexus sp.]MBO9381769.1 hypothetical protein [Roseiflexus sp.]MBO9387939.1 hypothetical protein [Roseiflexus sp.]
MGQVAGAQRNRRGAVGGRPMRGGGRERPMRGIRATGPWSRRYATGADLAYALLTAMRIDAARQSGAA